MRMYYIITNFIKLGNEKILTETYTENVSRIRRIHMTGLYFVTKCTEMLCPGVKQFWRVLQYLVVLNMLLNEMRG